MSSGIPSEHIKAIDTLIRISDADFDQLLTIFQETNLGVDLEDFIQNASLNINNLDISESRTEEIISFLSSLYIASEIYSLPLSEIIESLQEKIIESQDFTNIPLSEKENTKNRIQQLLTQCPSLQVASKRNNLKYEYENIFSNSRVFTDIRPIFFEKISEGVISEVVVNVLKITYFKNRKQEEIYLSIDENDIEQLSEQLERAKRKIKAIKDR
ncbi:hypothetical protein [Acaryochloris sp. CCMEE 5410]|uniref:hypothetical protein n=1 Tax=Acaryochloris sp. CCMEE 5410 TaxID=310037 RepID=UPI0002483E30|nr:hypothetical protein [Acaryochloris sp. CCMEE 5410]KAI9134348.1 hypothetical protein ON05_014375 [Acaryochloris sp. CCMEE 5410]